MKKVLLAFVAVSTLFVGCKKDELSEDKQITGVEIGILNSREGEVNDIKVSLFKTLEDAINDKNVVVSKISNSEGYCSFEDLEERDYYVLAEGENSCMSNIEDLVYNKGEKSKITAKKGTKIDLKREFIFVNKVGFVKVVNTLNENIEVKESVGEKRFLKGYSNGNFDETIYIVNTDRTGTLYLDFYIAGELTRFKSESIPYDELDCRNVKTINVEKPKVPVTKITYETVPLLNEEHYWLNSPTYLGFDKKTRIAIPINIPLNTVKIVYSISTTSGKTPVKNLKLGVQLASLLIDATGTLGVLANKIDIPESTSPGRVDVYLLDNIYKDDFLNKNDGNWKKYISGSRDSFVKGILEVDNSDISYTGLKKNLIEDRLMYICLRNPRTTHGVNITIEVSAIIQKETIVYE